MSSLSTDGAVESNGRPNRLLSRTFFSLSESG